MGSNPINLAVRFLLEITVLISVGIWGWKQSDGWMRYLLAFSLPILFAVIWGVFAVPDDPSRSGAAPVPTPGFIRLILELCFFSFATWAIYAIGYTKPAMIFGLIVLIHYIISYDRILWLFSH